MRTLHKNSIRIMIASVVFVALILPVKAVLAMDADQQRRVDQQIEELEKKIQRVKEDYKQEGDWVNQRIQGYEERIADVKRNAKTENETSINSLVRDLRKDFNEWRLKRSIRAYEDKLADMQEKIRYEKDPDKKVKANEKVQKLDVQYSALKAKLNDLRATEGENWDVIEKELDASLGEIEQDYKAMR